LIFTSVSYTSEQILHRHTQPYSLHKKAGEITPGLLWWERWMLYWSSRLYLCLCWWWV